MGSSVTVRALGLEVNMATRSEREPMTADEFYVMPAFTTLAVQDLQMSSKWYQDVLSFFVLFEVPGHLVHLRRDRFQDILLKPAATFGVDTSDQPLGRGVSLCFSVGTVADVDQLGSHAVERNTTVIEGPVNRPWNVREIVLSDPDGYCLTLSGGPVADVSF